MGRQVSRAYHDAIGAACREVMGRWGRGLLVDLHAQKAELDVVRRGTKNGRTVARLIERAGSAAFNGEGSLTEDLVNLGLTVAPKPDGAMTLEHSRFSGGYTVGYGGANGCGVDAIQLETSGRLFRKPSFPGTSAAMSMALVRFLDRHYPWR